MERSYWQAALWASSSLTVLFLQSRWGAGTYQNQRRLLWKWSQGSSISPAGQWWSLSRFPHNVGGRGRQLKKLLLGWPWLLSPHSQNFHVRFCVLADSPAFYLPYFLPAQCLLTVSARPTSLFNLLLSKAIVVLERPPKLSINDFVCATAVWFNWRVRGM